MTVSTRRFWKYKLYIFSFWYLGLPCAGSVKPGSLHIYLHWTISTWFCPTGLGSLTFLLFFFLCRQRETEETTIRYWRRSCDLTVWSYTIFMYASEYGLSKLASRLCQLLMWTVMGKHQGHPRQLPTLWNSMLSWLQDCGIRGIFTMTRQLP